MQVRIAVGELAVFEAGMFHVFCSYKDITFHQEQSAAKMPLHPVRGNISRGGWSIRTYKNYC